MHIEIKTLQNIRDNRVKLEITIGPAEAEKVGQRPCEGSGCPNMSDVRQELSAEIERLTDTSEYYVRTIDSLKADLARERAAHVCTSKCSPDSHVAIKGRRLVTELEAEVERLKTDLATLRTTKTDAVNGRDLAIGELHELFREATDKLSEVGRIVNHGDVTSQLDPTKATGSWGETLAEAIQQVRHVLSSPPSSQA